MDTVLFLSVAGVIVAAIGVAATVIIWVLRSVFNLGGLHAKVDVLTEKVDDLGKLRVEVGVLTERVDALTERVDDLAEGQKRLESKIDAMQADLHRVINMMTGLANHRHDVDGNTVFNVPPNP